MARISTYSLDESISGGDKWIGSDSGFYNKTKNFTPLKLADYFNSSEKIDSSNSLRFWYQTLDPLEERSIGTISFESEVGASVAFSGISSFLLSKNTEGIIYIYDFFNSLIESKILLHKADTVNTYAIYEVTAIEEYEDNSEFIKVSVSFIRGNGGLLEDKSYLISVIDFALDNIPDTPTPTLESVLVEGNQTNGNDISITDGDEITFDNGSRIRKGLTDAGNGGAKGVALVCSLDYELKWEAGRQYVMQQDGFTIREVSHNFTIVPTATDDETKGFAIGSRWILDNGDVYECTDATEDNAVWELTTIDLSGYVPYTGATQDVDLGEYEIKAGQVEFDQTPTGAAGVGVMRWNDTDGTIDLGLKGGNVTLQVGQESVVRVVNKTATNINLLEANYQAVRVTGAQGQRLKVDLALATNDLLSAETIGLVTETINNNQEGFITTSGLIRGINTTGSLQGETWADGNVLYLSPTTAGRVTNIKPTAPSHLVVIGYVIHAHANQGSIFVKVDNGYELEELHNVTTTNYTTPIDTDSLLTYDVTTSLWKRLSWSNIKSNLKTYFDGIYESLSNKSTATTLGTSDTLYPTQNAVKTYVDGKKQKIIFYNRSQWTFPNVAGAPFPLISSTNFELATANLNSTTDNALTALNNTSVIFMPIGIAPANMKLKRVILEGRQTFGSWQGFNLRCVVGSNRTIQATTISYSHLDSQVVEDFTHITTLSGNLFVNKEVTSSVVVPQNHGVIVMLSYSRTGIAISPVISTYLEFEIE